MSSSFSAYLAKNYLTASSISHAAELSTRPKKRRKRDPSSAPTSGLIIADDDADLSLSSQRNRTSDENDENPQLDTSARSAEFRRAKKNNWKTINDELPITSGDAANQATADRILAEAVRDSDVRRKQANGEVEGDDGPTVAGQTEDLRPEPEPESQTPKAGLQTAEDTARLLAAASNSSSSRALRKSTRDVAPEETVYRDATGRRIDISAKRAEARAAEEERLRQERREKEAAMGEVQRREREKKKQQVQEAKFLGVARYADDLGMNEEMKEVRRWGDPMAGYVTQQPGEEVADKGKRKDEGVRGRRAYRGAAAPNRYGIRPGWRWDGVDRGNGFEKDWFQARGRKSRNENLEYQWQMDE